MTLIYSNESETEFDFDTEKLADKTVETVLSLEGFPENCEVSLTVTTPDSIRQVNNEFRDNDTPTDVLSFPLLEFESVGSGYEGMLKDTVEKNLQTGDIILGDILINAERVISQAQEYGHSPEREFAFLIVHSMLHLLGYDHMDSKDEEIMRERQRVVMKELGLSR